MRMLVTCCLVMMALSAVTALPQLEATPFTDVDALQLVPNGTVVTGLSAGAFFASQFHVAFSSDLVGAGIIAGGPFYCAQGNEDVALTSCMSSPSGIDVDTLVGIAKYCEQAKACDPVSNLASQKVWAFTGLFDTVVNSGVVDKLVSFYQSFMNSSSIGGSIDAIGAEHSWPTNYYGNSCSTLGSPYINNCNYDASFEMLNFILGDLNQPTTASASNVKTISQQQFTPNGADPSSISLGPDAFLYVPSACTNGTQCRLVIALHGCQQTLSNIGTDFVGYTGLNEVAEANNFVVLYPQAIVSYLPGPLNPEGCFDWWGYTDSNYSNNQGPQMVTVKNMVDYLVNNIKL